MRLKNISIKNFKRFKNLSINNIPKTAKLVVLTGPNGSGKTSLFEAFNYWSSNHLQINHQFDYRYYLRREHPLFDNTNSYDQIKSFLDNISIDFHDVDINNQPSSFFKSIFYIRPAYRFSPDFRQSDNIYFSSSDSDELNPKNPINLISSDTKVEENYKDVLLQSMSMLFNDENKDLKANDIKNAIIGDVRNAMQAVFDDLLLEGIGNPKEERSFSFSKGNTRNFHYKNLSGGEKAAFDLILDFIVKTKIFEHSIYCIDEPELHMHTRLQSKLINAMFDIIPSNGQLWISTHSIGMAKKADELKKANPDTVAFIDFHERNFDDEVIIEPATPNKNFWKNIFYTALDELGDLIVPDHIVFCEGKKLTSNGKKQSFDQKIYSTIFCKKYPNIEFIPLGGGHEVEKDGNTIAYILSLLAPGIKSWKILDKDDRNKGQIEDLNKENTFVLGRRDIESYLWDNEVLTKLFKINDKMDRLPEILSKKENLIAGLDKRGKLNDDIKSITGEMYTACKSMLNINGCGNDPEYFAIENLAPIITQEMEIYKELEEIIIHI